MSILTLEVFVNGLPYLSKLTFLFFLLDITLSCFLDSGFLSILSFFFLSALTSNLAVFSNLSFGAFFLEVSILTLEVFVNGFPYLSKLTFLFFLLDITLSCFLDSGCLSIFSFLFLSALTSNLPKFLALPSKANASIYNSPPFLVSFWPKTISCLLVP